MVPKLEWVIDIIQNMEKNRLTSNERKGIYIRSNLEEFLIQIKEIKCGKENKKIKKSLNIYKDSKKYRHKIKILKMKFITIKIGDITLLNNS